MLTYADKVVFEQLQHINYFVLGRVPKLNPDVLLVLVTPLMLFPKKKKTVSQCPVKQ